MGDFGIGAAVRRKEDFRFLTGQGTYTDDINRPGQLHAFLLRSPHAHAELGAIDTAAAKTAPGVAAVFTGADVQVGGLPCGWLVTSKDGKPMIEPQHPLLAQGKVRHVGDPVAAIIAETREQAKDAAELIDVSYKTLPAVVTSDAAIKPGSPLLFDTAPGNLCFDWHLGDKAAVDAAFARADHITRLDLVNNRLVSNPMEPRAAVGEYNRATGEYTLYTTSQAPHVHRLLIAAFVLQLPEHKLRVVAPDVGGGFGTKGSLYNEQALVLWLAAKVGRPVKWTAERGEIFLTDNQARDHLTKAELALDKDGKFLALRAATLANLGAYLGSFAPAIPTWCYGTLLAGNYATPAIYVEVKGVFTNTAPVDIVHGDTGQVPFGMGTYASRSLAVGGTALVKAMDKIVAKAKKIATHLLEAAEADVEFADGKFSVAGTDRGVPFAQVAFAAYVPHNYPIETLEPGLNETAFYDPINFTYPAGAYIAEIEIDRETGTVELANFTGADDFGRIINPLIVEGQVHGALVQGIGHAVYDDQSGQLKTGSFMDYCMPRADNFLPFKLETNATLCAHNPLGAKGCGEAGTIGAPGAIMNAVVDAMAPLGIVDIDMPATSERVWRAMA